MRDPWDFSDVYGALHAFAREYAFDPDEEEYLVHITTGTHVWQICLFLLTETRHLPARLVQTRPEGGRAPYGSSVVIDLDLSRYDQLAERFADEQREHASFLKAGIDTRNDAFNALIDRIEEVALHSTAPILLTGATGVGKTQLARRIFELRRRQHMTQGAFVEVNCATLRGDAAMSALFGHVRGAFTGAVDVREGFLRAADGGVLFLDEIGELGFDEQTMLLRALEEKTFVPVGADRPVRSDFQLLAGTNRDLAERVRDGNFREDLLARIDLWSFHLPSLRDRLEDLPPNVEYELERFAREHGRSVSFNKEARARFLAFATEPGTAWRANFRDLGAAMTRMATLAHGGRITVDLVTEEIERLRRAWGSIEGPGHGSQLVEEILGADAAAELDLFDRVQLEEVLRVARSSRTQSEAGRTLFAQSRQRKTSRNDADRVAKYLARFGLKWKTLADSGPR